MVRNIGETSINTLKSKGVEKGRSAPAASVASLFNEYTSVHAPILCLCRRRNLERTFGKMFEMFFCVDQVLQLETRTDALWLLHHGLHDGRRFRQPLYHQWVVVWTPEGLVIQSLPRPPKSPRNPYRSVSIPSILSTVKR